MLMIMIVMSGGADHGAAAEWRDGKQHRVLPGGAQVGASPRREPQVHPPGPRCHRRPRR